MKQPRVIKFGTFLWCPACNRAVGNRSIKKCGPTALVATCWREVDTGRKLWSVASQTA